MGISAENFDTHPATTFVRVSADARRRRRTLQMPFSERRFKAAGSGVGIGVESVRRSNPSFEGSGVFFPAEFDPADAAAAAQEPEFEPIGLASLSPVRLPGAPLSPDSTYQPQMSPV